MDGLLFLWYLPENSVENEVDISRGHAYSTRPGRPALAIWSSFDQRHLELIDDKLQNKRT